MDVVVDTTVLAEAIGGSVVSVEKVGGVIEDALVEQPTRMTDVTDSASRSPLMPTSLVVNSV